MSSTIRLYLVRHATSAETRAGRFPATSGASEVATCAPLDEPGRRMAEVLADHLPRADRVWSSWAARSRQTAALAGLSPEPVADLAECDFGRWAGRDVHEVAEADPDGFAAWLADPAHAAHGGEALHALRERARRVLQRCEPGATVAFTHGGFIRALLAEALRGSGTPWVSLDVAPASVTELHARDGRWRLVRLNWIPGPTKGPPLAEAVGE